MARADTWKSEAVAGVAREPAPPYAGEGPHALWHVSEDGAIDVFRPRNGLVWAIDTRHLPIYWFPRDCPRGTFWAHSGSSGEDVARLLGGDRRRRVHAVERHRLPELRRTRVFAYRLPAAPFVPHESTGGYWLARETVEPLERVELGDLAALHERAGIEIRPVDALLPLWDEVIASTLEYSGIRLRNARR